MTRRLPLFLVLICALTLVAEPQRRFFATLDIGDNYWKTYCTFRGADPMPLTAGSYTIENIHDMVDTMADLGFTRLYKIICLNELFDRGGWLAVLKDGRRHGGAALLKDIAGFCHARGMEFFIIVKLFENSGKLFPPGCPVPPGFDTVECLQGTAIAGYPILAASPGIRHRRRLSPMPRDPTVAQILLINRDDTPITTLSRNDFQLFAGPKNGIYREIADFTVEPQLIERDNRTYSALAFQTDSLTAADRFFLVKCSRQNDTPQLVNTTLDILELHNRDGELIPKAVATAAIPRSDLMQDLVLLRLYYFPEDTRVPPEWEPPKSYGATLETTAFDYDNSSSIPTIQLDGKSGRNGYIAFAANEIEYLGSLHPCYPEVMALWKKAVDELIGADVDGIDIRIGDHASWTTYGSEYGFNAPVVTEYRRRYGVDPLTDDSFDRALWRQLNGEYITGFVRWSSQRLHEKGKRLHVQISLPVFDRDFWTLNDAPANYKYEWKKWMDEHLVDGISLKYMPFPWGRRAGTGVKTAKMLTEKARALGIESSIEARTAWWLQPTDSHSPPFTDEQYQNYIKEFSMLQGLGVDALNFYEVSDYFMIDSFGKPQYSKRFAELLDELRKTGE